MTSGPARPGEGAVRFARFAYPPNELGYCGPDDHDALFGYAAAGAGAADGGLVELARGFDGAWPYLCLIAEANGIGDPLDPRVVDAYWVGNRLLDRVDMQRMGNSLQDRFRARAASAWQDLAAGIPAGALPHHSYHVFGVYPWVGLLHAGTVEQPLRILDRCRIRWGRVTEVYGDTATVVSAPLTWNGSILLLGPAAPEVVRLGSGGSRILEATPGDWVALHWDWVCDLLDAPRIRSLVRYTRRHLDIVNALPRPAPAVVLG
jgi:hypothetical protein